MKSRDKRRKLKKRKHEPADQIKPESRAQKGQAAGSYTDSRQSDRSS